MINRIILTTNYSPWSPYSGGGQRSTHNIAQNLASIGIDVHVIYSKTLFETIKQPSDLKYCVHWAKIPGISSSRKNWFRAYSLLQTKNIVRRLLTTNCIVHSNGEEGALIGSLKYKNKFGFIATPRYPQIPNNIGSIDTSFSSAIIHLNNSKYILLHKLLKEVDVIVPTSTYAKKMLLNRFELGNKPFQIVPNGVSNAFFRSNAEHKDPESKNIIFFGRLSYSKGVDTLLRAAELSHQHFDNLIIIGRGELEYLIKEKANNGPLKNKIQLLPWMDTDDLITQLSNATVAVLPSREESFGNSIAESMACSTPVITSNAGSIPEIIQSEDQGILIEPEDYKQFSNSLIDLLNNPQKRQLLSENGKKRVENNFSWMATSNRYLDIYNQLV